MRVHAYASNAIIDIKHFTFFLRENLRCLRDCIVSHAWHTSPRSNRVSKCTSRQVTEVCFNITFGFFFISMRSYRSLRA